MSLSAPGTKPDLATGLVLAKQGVSSAVCESLLEWVLQSFFNLCSVLSFLCPNISQFP